LDKSASLDVAQPRVAQLIVSLSTEFRTLELKIPLRYCGVRRYRYVGVSRPPVWEPQPARIGSLWQCGIGRFSVSGVIAFRRPRPRLIQRRQRQPLTSLLGVYEPLAIHVCGLCWSSSHGRCFVVSWALRTASLCAYIRPFRSHRERVLSALLDGVLCIQSEGSSVAMRPHEA